MSSVSPAKLHVLILNQTFWPDHAATAQHMWDLARHLDAQGHRVTVLTSRYYYGTDRPFEKAYERVGEQIEIHRVRGTGFGKGNILGRLADFASFYVAAAARLVSMEQPDVTLALTSPPMIAGLAMVQAQVATSAKRSRRVRFVYHVMDLYPDAAVAGGTFGATSVLTKVLRLVTRATVRRADAIVALGRDMRDRLVGEYGMADRAGRIEVITPWAHEEQLAPMEKTENPLAKELGLAETFNVVYSGNFGLAHDADTIVRAIEATRDEAGMRWVFIGSGKRYDPLKRQAEQAGWRHVAFLPFQDQSVLNQSLNLADVHLVSQLPAFTGIVVPSKLFGILAVGKPSLMVGPADAEVSRILAETGSGVVVNNGDVEGLVAAIRTLRSDPAMRERMGRMGREAFLKDHSTAVCCMRLEQVLLRAVAG